jgi:hypothetical protein
VIALIEIAIISFVFWLCIRFRFARHRPALAGLGALQRTRAWFKFLALTSECRMDGKRQGVLIFLQASNTLSDGCPFEHTGHRNHVISLHEVQTHGHRTSKGRIGRREAEFFSRRFADQ